MKTPLFTCLLLTMFTLMATAQDNEEYFVNSETLNMRSGPGKDYKVIKMLSKDDIVDVIRKLENNWWEIDFNGTKGYVYSQLLKISPYSSWEKIKHESGATPDCENITPKYDFNIDNLLRINVGLSTDVIVKLIKKENHEDECVRIVYVRGGENYDIKNIPEGEYYLKIAYGKDYRKNIIDNVCYVKFLKNAHYEKGTNILDFNKVKMPNQIIGDKIYENWKVPSFELYLDVIMGKDVKSSFNSNNISESEFNN